MPKANCDSRVHLMLVAHAKLLRIPFESKGSLHYMMLSGSPHVIEFQWDQQIHDIAL